MQDAVYQLLYGLLYGGGGALVIAALFDRQRRFGRRGAAIVVRFAVCALLFYVAADDIAASGEPMAGAALAAAVLTLYALRGWWLPARLRLVLPGVPVDVRFGRAPARRRTTMPVPLRVSVPTPVPGATPAPRLPGASLRNRALRVVLDDRRPLPRGAVSDPASLSNAA